MNKKYKVTTFLVFSSFLFFSKNRTSAEVAKITAEATQTTINPFVLKGLRSIGNATYYGITKPFQLSNDYIINPAFNTGVSLAKASYQDPKVGMGLVTSAAALALIGKYYGIDQSIYNTTIKTKDYILPNKSIADFKTKNNDYTIKINDSNNGDNSHKWETNKNLLENISSKPTKYKIFMSNEYFQKNFIPGKSLLLYALNRTSYMPENIFISGSSNRTSYMPENIFISGSLNINGITRTIKDQTIPIRVLDNDIITISNMIYESYIQPMFYQPPSKKSSLEIKTNLKNQTSYICSIYPESNSFLSYDTLLKNNVFYNKKDSIEALKANFIRWIKKQIKRDENNNPTGINSLWILKPQIEALWNNNGFNKKTSFYLKNQNFSCNAYSIENTQRSINNNKNQIKALLASNESAYYYHTIMNELYNQLLNEINRPFEIKEQIESFKACLNNNSTNDKPLHSLLDTYINNYKKDLTTEASKKTFNDLITGYTHVINLLEDNYSQDLKKSDFTKTIMFNLKELNESKHFRKIEEVTKAMIAANNKNIPIETVQLSLKIIGEILENIKTIISSINTNYNQHLSLLINLKNEINRLEEFLKSDNLNLSKKILNLAGFNTNQDFHNFIELPKSFKRFLEHCLSSTDTKPNSTTDDLYVESIFELYIEPIFT